MTNAAAQGADGPPHIPGLELREKVGEGGASVVYRAVHLNLQREVAVKVLRGPAEEGAAVPAWLRESRLMASLAHPHVVTIHDAGQVGGHNYLVMEYQAGGSLRARLNPGQRWPLAQALPVVDSIAQALEHIHKQGILHLDLKPENLLYAADGQMKIADFGLAVPHADTRALIEGRYFQGTVDYCAPEQRHGLALDARADVFALATLAYELLTGRLPGRLYVPASARNPQLPAAMDEVLRRGLARDPEERYASAGQFRQAFHRACRQTRSRVPARLLGAAVALALLVVVLLVVHNWTNTTQQSSGLPTRLWVVYDKPEELALFAGEAGRELSSGTAVAVERIQVENPAQEVPPELAIPVWPTPRPVLIIHSPGAWGFVQPLLDRTLGQRVVKDWPALLRTAVPPEKNFVKAGGFDGDCLRADHGGDMWRIDEVGEAKPSRNITIGWPRDQPDNPALLLSNLDPARSNDLLKCYQPLARAPAPGAVVVLRYRARADSGRPHVQIYLTLPLLIPPPDFGPAATRIRRLSKPLPVEDTDPTPNRWSYQVPVWVTPAEDWQTYVVIHEAPPFRTQPTHRNLCLVAVGAGRVWVDDVELFVWQPGGAR
jgi:hypothetical protein